MPYKNSVQQGNNEYICGDKLQNRYKFSSYSLEKKFAYIKKSKK